MEENSREVQVQKAAELISKHQIDAASLVNMLKPFLARSYRSLIGAALEALYEVKDFYDERPRIKHFHNKALSFFDTIDEKKEEIITTLNRLRHTELPSLVPPLPSIPASGALFVYKIPDHKKYYYITSFRNCFDWPSLIIMPEALSNNAILHYFFALSRLFVERQEVGDATYDFWLKTIRKDKRRRKKLKIFPWCFSYFNHLVTAWYRDCMWLFFEAACK